MLYYTRYEMIKHSYVGGGKRLKKKYYLILFISLFLVPVTLFVIGFIKVHNSKIVTLTLWHNYGGQMKNTMDEMIQEFNETLGKKNHVYISVTSISGSTTLHEKLTMAANEVPGAPDLPDITTAYPKTALQLAKNDLLVNLDDYFSEQDLAKYISRFIEEGRILDEGLYVFPTAKSTEVLFLNRTIFDRFSKDTGVTIDDLKTFEGIMNTAAIYYEWTDQQTPDIDNDGKSFFLPDSLFHYTYIGAKQLGGDFIQGNEFNFEDDRIKKIWELYYESAVLGHTAIYDGYASNLERTGDVICSTGSTAGVLFFPDTVTYQDNTSEKVELTILPYPLFEGGKKIAVQRGAGMSVLKSDPKKEELAVLFLDWFTLPENNLRFVSSTGYLPVTKEAYGDIMLKEIEEVSDPNIKELMQVVREMQMLYDYDTPPLFDKIDELQEDYENELFRMAAESRAQLISLTKKMEASKALSYLLDDAYEEFKTRFDFHSN